MGRDSDLPDELLYGRAGYLYALLYLNTEIGPGAVSESAIKEVRGRGGPWGVPTPRSACGHSRSRACPRLRGRPSCLY